MDVIQDQPKDQYKLQNQTQLRQLQLQKEIHDDRDNDQQQSQQQQQQQQQYQQQNQQQKQGQQYNYALQSNLQKNNSQTFKKSNLMLINGYVSDDKLNQEEVLLVHAINSVGCKNYGLAADLVDKYPYSETAGGRYCDSNLKCIAREEDRTPEGSCLIRPAPLYIKGPKIASLVTQFGLGRPYEENRLAQKIVRNCGQESFVKRLRHDTSENRLIHFNKALKSLSASLKTNTRQDTNKVVLPIGIGCSGVSEKWLCRYYEIIKKFAQDMSYSGIHCYIAVRKQHLYAIDRYVSKKCSQKAQLQLKELKSLAWKDVDDRWFNELINKKEEKLLHNIERSNSTNTSNTITPTDSTSSGSNSGSGSGNNNNNQITMDVDNIDVIDDDNDDDDDDDDDLIKLSSTIIPYILICK